MQQFKRFCFIGGLGFLVDSVFFLFINSLIDNIMLTRLLSFWLAACVTWFGNRIYTYNNKVFTSTFIQWCKHMLSVHLSGGINLFVFWFSKDFTLIPIAFCLGISAGLFSNYFFASRFVFKRHS
jgi:putative flippase GtrA